MPAGDMTRTEQVDDDFIPADARPVCMKCLQPCHPLQYYCDKCDSNDVINPLASYMPIERIRFNCDIFLTMWQRVFHDRDTSAVTRLSYFVHAYNVCADYFGRGTAFIFNFWNTPIGEENNNNSSLYCSDCVINIFLFWQDFHRFTNISHRSLTIEPGF